MHVCINKPASSSTLSKRQPSNLHQHQLKEDFQSHSITPPLIQRRPSLPQGGLEWRMRRRVHHQDGRFRQRRKTVSVGKFLENEEDDEDATDDVFLHDTSCPHFQPRSDSGPRSRTPNTTGDTQGGGGGSGCPPVRDKVLRAEERTQAKHNERENLADSLPLTTRLHPTAASPVFPETKTHECTCLSKGGTDTSRTKNNNNNNNTIDVSKSGPAGIRRGGGGRAKKGKKRNRRETVVLNVGGHVFETYRATVRRLRTPIFTCEDQLELYYRESHGDYFFDRDPTAFGSILNYLRTGELHIPTNMCGPALQNELEFWGIEESDISRCCWTQYNTWKTQCRSLEKLEYDRKFSTTQQVPSVDEDSSCWVRFRSKIWTFLQDPGSSRKAKVYAWVSIIFVFISIFSFCAETHPIFKVKAKDMTHMASFYQFLHIENIQWSKVNLRPNQTASNSSESPHTKSAPPNLDSSTSANSLGTKSPETQVAYKRQKRRFKRKATMGENFCLTESLGDKPEVKEDDWDNKELPHPALLIMDVSCLIFFTLEYITRFVCSPSKITFLRASQNIVDFLAFAPDYIEMLFLIIDPIQNEGMAIMEMLFILRILRLFRIFRLIRHVPGLWILLYTLKASFNELMLMCVFLLIGMVVFATLMHFVEPNGIFTNIPVGFWWSVVTMTTVGYGDMYPQSASGYFIGSCCAVAGLLMIAFTVPIIVSNFVLYYTHVQYGLTRKERDAISEEDEVEFTGSRSALDIERADSALLLPSVIPVLVGPHTSTSRNGKSYTFLNNATDSLDAAEADSMEMQEHCGELKNPASPPTVFFLEN
ncbi:potassium voltage-gated channel protein egl-36-like isoform X2 [Biomphalaria glabrata]|uniref:Potassium voltage-gated channel protein egl-36-like isoform X2 n=1 Tax=Biomphalaria glabrata TaxID=6526 RepID=A0A9W2YJX8_BIOGL|nr:potassium voltage-gated channel protein egl-36-like isoform X2 [Biomphalaria glabrata]